MYIPRKHSRSTCSWYVVNGLGYVTGLNTIPTIDVASGLSTVEYSYSTITEELAISSMVVLSDVVDSSKKILNVSR